ncbi:hypothetical protein [Jeotgalicoccus sp. WY2]|uniref:coiled-coil domain-containing protein n=1 Tax=Jeotgalicoccus sp. WY2 TaxID=2708346 RepID=UPI001BD3E1A3|nr:hypothetical protein [Jeotgalicoccus sp. WY2]
MIFDLIDYSNNEIQTEITEVQNQILNKKNKMNNLLGYLDQRGNSNYSELISEIENFDIRINKLIKRKEDLIEMQNSEKELVSSNREFTLLNSELNELDSNIVNIEGRKKEINLSIVSNEYLLSDYQSEMNDIKATGEINYKLVIDKHILTCPLCNSEVENKLHNERTSKSTTTNFNRILKAIDNKVKMVHEVLDSSNTELEELEIELNNNLRKKEILELALQEFSKDIKVPYLPQINSINININTLEKDREILVESKRVFNKVSEFKKIIEDDESTLNTLKHKLSNTEGKRKEI